MNKKPNHGEIRTKLDEILSHLKKKKEEDLKYFAKKFKEDEELIEEWAKILEDEELIKIEYSALGNIILKINDGKKE